MMLSPFKLERYFALYEFNVQHLLSPSDCESLALKDLLAMADEECHDLWDNLRLSYTEAEGHPILRQEISGLYSNIAPEQTLVAVPEEAIFIAMHTLLHPGDHVVAISPAYQSLHEIARSSGSKLRPWIVQRSPQGWQLNLDELAELLTPNTRLLVINFPHNPTGFLPSEQEFRAILELAAKQGAFVFSDEMYRGLEYNSGERLPAACDLYERAISLSGLSKTFALPGLRIGWLATQQRNMIERFLAFKDYTTICHSAPSEILGIIALRNQAAIIQRNLEIIQNNLDLAESFFAEYSRLFEWLPPCAGSVAFPRWRGPGSVEAFCQQALDQQGVMIVPGSLFDYPGHHFRVGLGRRNFGEALNSLTKILSVEA